MRSALLTGMTLIVILLLFLAFNLVWAVKLPDLRWDVSKQQTNTLSPSALHLLGTLESPLDFYFFNSRSLTVKNSAQQHYGRRVEEKLKAFERAANGRINLHIIDPAPFSEDAYKAGLYGLDNNQGFLGLIGNREGHVAQRIALFSPDREALLEYEVSHLITQLVHPAPPVIGLLSGLSREESIESLLPTLHRHFELMQLEASAALIPPRIKTLMLVNPHGLAKQTLYAIDQFVLGGGKLLMFIDPLGTQDSRPTLDALLASWGLKMPSGQVLVDGNYAASQDHPALLTLPRQAMTTSDVSTWKLNSVTVSNSSALFPVDKSRTTVTPLLQSSRQAALVNPDSSAGAMPTQGERYVIAARVEGPAYSAFPDGLGGWSPGLQKAAQIHAVVVAALPGNTLQDNLFVLNTLDNLAAPEALANIRPRMLTGHSLGRLEDLREAAAHAYQAQAAELEQRLARTEKEWQRLNPPVTTPGTEAVNTNTQLQALNKERLRLPMELQALETEAYAAVRRLEQKVKLLVIVSVPLLLCLAAWGLFRWRHRRRALPPAAFY